MPVRVFPVRHHSPSASRCLAALLKTNPPKAILVEGPSDAESLIPVLVDEETEPPIAILAYVAGGEGRVALYPLVRLAAQGRAGIPSRFAASADGGRAEWDFVEVLRPPTSSEASLLRSFRVVERRIAAAL